MQKQLLKGTDIATTPIGYGCAGLMRILSRKKRRAILEAAYDAGIRHYDAARMYGDGAVEGELRGFLSRHRDQVVVTTKFGLKFQPPTGLKSLIKRGGRMAVSLFPQLRRAAPQQGSRLPRDFSARAARISLQTSLRALGVEYVDLFLLHEPLINQIPQEELLEYLEQAKQAGLMRAYGIAGYPQQLQPVCTGISELSAVIQIPNDPVERQLEEFRSYAESAFITFSPYANAVHKIHSRTSADSALAKRWSESVGMDLTDRANICRLLMAYSLRANQEGVVLFFSSRRQGIREAVDTLRSNIDDTALAHFAHLVKTEL